MFRFGRKSRRRGSQILCQIQPRYFLPLTFQHISDTSMRRSLFISSSGSVGKCHSKCVAVCLCLSWMTGTQLVVYCLCALVTASTSAADCRCTANDVLWQCVVDYKRNTCWKCSASINATFLSCRRSWSSTCSRSVDVTVHSTWVSAFKLMACLLLVLIVVR